jgi:PAS domain S-box-containing protein
MKPSFKILHIEDVQSDALMVEEELRKHQMHFECRVVETKKDFLAAVENYIPDIILSDHSLPKFNSVDALKIVHEKGLNIPFILVTTPTSEEFAVTVIKQGADDYVLKDRLQRLPDAMLNAIKKKHCQNEQQRLLEELKKQEDQSRKELHKTSYRMVLAAKAAQVGVWDWNIPHNTLEWDTTMQRLNGLGENCLEGGFESWEKCMHPYDIPRIRQEMYLALSGEKDFNTEYRTIWPDGTIHFIKAAGIVQRDDEGSAERMLGTNWDVTERKSLEDQLKRSEDFYRALIESSTETKCLTLADGTIIYMGSSVTKILGFTPQQMIGKHFADFVHPDDRKLLSKQLRTLIKRPEKNTRIQIRCINKQGKYNWFEGNVINLLDKPGFNSLIFTCWDISARKKAEIKLEEQNKELLKTNAELDSFVYSASHELRAPLCSVLGLIQLMGHEEKSPEKLEFLSMMQKSIQTLDVFINNIIQYSRNSRLEIEPEKINFKELISKSVSEFIYLDGTSKLEIITEDHENAEFYSDKSRIKIIINNLLSNAISYHNFLQPKPYIHIRVWVNTETAVIEVSDNGRGIDERFLDKIFKMFYRATNIKTGAGLGLYIVKETLNKLSGSITVKSKVGSGTTFFVTIPNAKLLSDSHAA